MEMKLISSNYLFRFNKTDRIKRIISFLIILFVISLFYIYYSNSLIYTEKKPERISNMNLDSMELKTSKISGRIHINNNWSFAGLAGICSGSGNYSDPYIIQDLVINGQNSSSPILIENSNDYFRIVNCTVFNSSEGSAGIKLNSVNNGTLINNTCYNNWYGILLSNCNNNTIFSNNASFNKITGIKIFVGNKNNITKNIANNNAYYDINGFSHDMGGIFLDYCQNTTISENKANHNNWNGISLYMASYNNITNNEGNNNDYNNGIYLSNSENNNISENDVNSNYRHGIELYHSNKNNISRNTATNNFAYGISIFTNSTGNKITKNVIYNNHGTGIVVTNNLNNTLSGNSLDHNGYTGISIYNSNNTNISDNYVSNCDVGISIMDKSHSNFLSGNQLTGCGLMVDGPLEALVSHNINILNTVNGKHIYYYSNRNDLWQTHFDYAGQVILINCTDSLIANLQVSAGSSGIILQYCINNQIFNVNSSKNTLFGFYLKFCDNNTISENIGILNKEYGINLVDSNNNMLLENELHNNTDGIHLYQSHNNTIYNNNITKNWHGIETEYSHNNVIFNNTINNNDIGIYLFESNFNSIKENDLRYNTIPYEEYNCVGNEFINNITEDKPGDNGLPNVIFIIIIIVSIIITVIAISVVIIWKKKGSIQIKKKKTLDLELVPPIETPEVEKEINIFLSYSTLDSGYFQISKIAKKLVKSPEITNVLFWELDSKQNIVEFMEETLKKTDVFVLFCSENSIKSKAVKDEWQAAFQLRKEDLMKIVPVYEKEEHIPFLLKPMLNVKFSKEEFNAFIQKLYEEILR